MYMRVGATPAVVTVASATAAQQKAAGVTPKQINTANFVAVYDTKTGQVSLTDPSTSAFQKNLKSGEIQVVQTDSSQSASDRIASAKATVQAAAAQAATTSASGASGSGGIFGLPTWLVIGGAVVLGIVILKRKRAT